MCSSKFSRVDNATSGVFSDGDISTSRYGILLDNLNSMVEAGSVCISGG